MDDRQLIPEGLAETPPDPQLAAILAGIDRTRLNGYDAVVLLQARARQLAHDQAQLLADMVEVGHCRPGHSESPVQRRPTLDWDMADEIAMALTLTRTRGPSKNTEPHQKRASNAPPRPRRHGKGLDPLHELSGVWHGVPFSAALEAATGVGPGRVLVPRRVVSGVGSPGRWP